MLLLWTIHVIFVLFLLCFCAHLFIDALWSPAGKGPTSWLSFVMSNCEVVTFPLVSWVRCGASDLCPLSYFNLSFHAFCCLLIFFFKVNFFKKFFQECLWSVKQFGSRSSRPDLGPNFFATKIISRRHYEEKSYYVDDIHMGETFQDYS